jgi:hypothetical protein
MDFVHLIWAALSDPLVTSAAYIGGALIVLDAATGILKAWRNGSFKLSWLDAFVKTRIASKYLPLMLTYIVAKATPDIGLGGVATVNPLAAFASASMAAFILSEIASIRGNFDDTALDNPPQGVVPPGDSPAVVTTTDQETDPVGDEALGG